MRAPLARMSSVLAIAACAIAVAASLSGCAGDGPQRPRPSEIPFVGGGRIILTADDCDKGANAYCALDLVFVNRRFGSSQALVVAERQYLLRHGWVAVPAQTGDELAADAPHNRFRITFASPLRDLKDIDLGWIKRPRSIQVALSRAVYEGSPAMSVNVVAGPS